LVENVSLTGIRPEMQRLADTWFYAARHDDANIVIRRAPRVNQRLCPHRFDELDRSLDGVRRSFVDRGKRPRANADGHARWLESANRRIDLELDRLPVHGDLGTTAGDALEIPFDQIHLRRPDEAG